MDDIKHQTLEATVAAAASKATYAGAGTSVWGWFASSEAGVILGIVIGVIGLLVNIFFRLRQDRRSQTEHEARMRAIRGEYL